MPNVPTGAGALLSRKLGKHVVWNEIPPAEPGGFTILGYFCIGGKPFGNSIYVNACMERIRKVFQIRMKRANYSITREKKQDEGKKTGTKPLTDKVYFFAQKGWGHKNAEKKTTDNDSYALL